ncbi:MAG: serine/threonine-protein kinase [Minicystis sp.]
MDLTPGAVIAGRYKVERKVGAGGMGEVWVGEHRTVGSKVAVKTLLSAAALNHEVVARFKREAYILGRIRSDHVARVVDFVADDVYGLVLVMEFVDGDALSRVLQEKTLTIEETIDLGVDIASALRDLHEAHIVHRDLKPGNIILQKLPGDRWRAVVVDFGVSRLTSDSDSNDEEITGITRADMAVGTIEYMAPEQILNSRAVTSASDIYATGAILYRAVAGRHVFGNIASDAELAQKKLMTEPPPLALSRGDKLATGLAAVVTKALKRRPAERYKTADDLLKDLLPLRDLARVSLVDLDSTTLDTAQTIAIVSPSQLAEAEAAISARMAQRSSSAGAAPAALPVESQPTPSSSASLGAAVTAATATPVPAAPSKGGVPVLVMVAAVVVALIGGAVLGSGVLGKKDVGAESGAVSATATVAPPPPTPTMTASPPPMETAPPASASAGSVPALDSASAAALAPDPADEVSDAGAAKKLWGTLPKATATATTAGVPTALPTAAPTPKTPPTAAATAPGAKPPPPIASPPTF